MKYQKKPWCLLINAILSIGYENESLILKATELGARLHLEVDNQSFPRLSVTPDKLVLLMKGCNPLYVDFDSSSLSRRKEAGRNQGLIKACKPSKGLKILDATAGWGRDAALLASFGAEVQMLERNPFMQVLLADALSRLNNNPFDSPLQLSLIPIDAISYLQQLHHNDSPDVIYIDPMHPNRQKSALVKKDMQLLQGIIGTDEDAEKLLGAAIGRARQRVVVKWPQRLPPLFKPHHSIEGKTVRFDVYL